MYSILTQKIEELRKYLKEKLAKDFIESTTSAFASPVLFKKKSGGGFRSCVDYRALNAIPRKNLYPLLRKDVLLRQLLKAKNVTRLNLRGSFNKIRIK